MTEVEGALTLAGKDRDLAVEEAAKDIKIVLI
jgi:hypothetical protein